MKYIKTLLLAISMSALSLTAYGASMTMHKATPQASEYYRPAVQAGHFLYVSGQNAQVGNDTLTDNVAAQTRTILGFINHTLKAHGYSFKNVVEVNVFLAKQADFKPFNKVYHTYFPNRPARSTSLGVLHQNKGALVEIALVAYKK